MHTGEMWDIIVEQRQELEGILRSLPLELWEHESLCKGWKVKDVAAHVISAPQLNAAAMVKVLPLLLVYGYNGMTLRDGQRRGSVGAEAILVQYQQFVAVRRGPAVVGVLETLTDTLVHTQDIVRPLGIRHDMPLAAAEQVAQRLEKTGVLLGSRKVLRTVRMEATDWEFSSGHGPLVSGPLAELVMLRAGRQPEWGSLRGPGVQIARQLYAGR
ncbi:maleylpyruvate isomerase family mycothiol-dependent enzyme [Glutamicibacter sp.]|uniref:maleylpyruvate isomerase family mycothiol-dependent enzyme n=1 Tax=Glutamicibacter sp. TaxID=1931995 RepID=UPI0028BE474B|nr:maleylpyruvate isomerase family mycothiol-dependent enzyme [Glutamicibacter sp.]